MATSDESLYRAGDVVVVPFPYSGRLAEKRRPALVVSNDELATEGFIWIAMITSAKNPRMRHDQPISKLARAGLSTASVVRPIKIACIEPARIVRRAGSLTPTEVRRVLTTVTGFIAPPTRRTSRS